MLSYEDNSTLQYKYVNSRSLCNITFRPAFLPKYILHLAPQMEICWPSTDPGGKFQILTHTPSSEV